MANYKTLLILALTLTACRGEFDDSLSSGTSSESGTEATTGDGDGDTTGGGDGDTTGSTDDTGSTDETSGTETTGPEPTVPMYGNCEVDEDCMEPATRCVLDDMGRGHCSHSCDSPLDCPLPDTGTSSASCLFDLCFVYCGANQELECPDGMVCGSSTWVGNPLSNVCIWP